VRCAGCSYGAAEQGRLSAGRGRRQRQQPLQPISRPTRCGPLLPGLADGQIGIRFPAFEPRWPARPLTDRTNVLLFASHDRTLRERRGCSGVPSGTLGRGSSSLGRRGPPRCARRGAPRCAALERRGRRSPGDRAGAGAGRRSSAWAPGRPARRAGNLDRISRAGCDSRPRRPAARRDDLTSWRRDERQDDTGAAGNSPDPGRGRDSRLPRSGSKSRPDRGCSPGRPARVAGRHHARFARGGAGDGRDAPSGPNGRSAGSGSAELAARSGRHVRDAPGRSAASADCPRPSSRCPDARSRAAGASASDRRCDLTGRRAPARAEPAGVDPTRAGHRGAADGGARGPGSVRTAGTGRGASNPVRGWRAAGRLPGPGRAVARDGAGDRSPSGRNGPSSRAGKAETSASGLVGSARLLRAGRPFPNDPAFASSHSASCSGLSRCDSSTSTGPIS